MDKKRWLIMLAAVTMLANAVILVYDRNWSALLWLLYGGWAFYVMLSQQKTIAEYHDLTREQEEHIHYLTDHDTWKQIRISETKAQNCLRYLKRIGELKMQVEQLKILNRNLLHNQGKGVKNYAKHTNRRADKRRTASDFE